MRRVRRIGALPITPSVPTPTQGPFLVRLRHGLIQGEAISTGVMSSPMPITVNSSPARCLRIRALAACETKFGAGSFASRSLGRNAKPKSLAFGAVEQGGHRVHEGAIGEHRASNGFIAIIGVEVLGGWVD